MSETSGRLGAADRESRLDLLIAKDEIRDCLARYARGIDRHDVELIHSAYHPDATDEHGAGFRGTREELAEWGNREHARHWTTHSHLLATSTIDVRGDVAASETYVTWVQKRRDTARADIGGGRYLDRLERRDGEWRIAERKLVVDWVLEVDSEDRRGILERYPTGRWDRTDPSYELFASIVSAAECHPG